MEAFKPLPINHQWIKKTFHYYLNFQSWLKKNIFTCSVMDNIILLHIDYSLYLYMNILNICCSALSAGKGGGVSMQC